MKPIYSPSHEEVDLALKAIETEDERQREALRKFYERERLPLQVNNKIAFWGFVMAICAIAFAVGFGWGYVFPIGR